MATAEPTEPVRRRRVTAGSNGAGQPQDLADVDAERALLGDALVRNPDALQHVARLGPGAFYSPPHRDVAEALIAASTAREPFDHVTVADWIRRHCGHDHGHLVTDLLSGGTGNPRRSAQIVADYAALRRFSAACREGLEVARSAPHDVPTALAQARAILDAATADTAVGRVEWSPVGAVLDGDNDPIEPDWLTRTDGRRLLYAGKMHFFQSPPEEGKTWLALAACTEALHAGGAVVIFDYEDTARTAVHRLLALGAKREAIRDRCYHLHCDATTSPAAMVAAAETVNPELVIIDSVAEALRAHGLDEDKASDVVGWIDVLPRPLARRGAAVVMLDHVVKSKEDQGRWARGSGAKLGAVDGAVFSLSSSGFNRTTGGRIAVRVAKDRPGGLDAVRGERIASVVIEPHNEGRLITWRLERPLPDDAPNPEAVDAARSYAKEQRDAEAAERIVAILNDASEPLSKVKLGDRLRAKYHGQPRIPLGKDRFGPLLEELLAEGRIGSHIGPKGHDVYTAPPRQMTLPPDPAATPEDPE
jgi:hypothetical protein